jgi:hypothetical protein
MDCFVAEFIIGPAEGGTRWLLATTMIGCLKFESGAQIRVVPANAGTHNHRR